jgi:hypothetical protein
MHYRPGIEWMKTILTHIARHGGDRSVSIR